MSGLFIPLADHKLLDSWTVCHSMRICGRQSNAHPVGQDMLFLSCSKHFVQFIYFLPNHRPLSQTLSFHIRPSSGMRMHKVSSRLPTFIAKPFHIPGTSCLENIFDCHVLGSSPWSWGWQWCLVILVGTVGLTMMFSHFGGDWGFDDDVYSSWWALGVWWWMFIHHGGYWGIIQGWGASDAPRVITSALPRPQPQRWKALGSAQPDR